MIPKQAIEKALEKSWICKACIEPEKNYPWYEHAIALDPTFWQALGKALGWREEEWHPTRTYPDGSQKTWAGYMPHAHRFYDLILTGGDTEKFWSDLLAT